MIAFVAEWTTSPLPPRDDIHAISVVTLELECMDSTNTGHALPFGAENHGSSSKTRTEHDQLRRAWFHIGEFLFCLENRRRCMYMCESRSAFKLDLARLRQYPEGSIYITSTYYCSWRAGKKTDLPIGPHDLAATYFSFLDGCRISDRRFNQMRADRYFLHLCYERMASGGPRRSG